MGKRPLKDITSLELDRFYAALVKTSKLSPATVRQVHAIIRRDCRQVQMWGWIDANPATPPKMVKPDLSPPDVEQVGEILRLATQR